MTVSPAVLEVRENGLASLPKLKQRAQGHAAGRVYRCQDGIKAMAVKEVRDPLATARQLAALRALRGSACRCVPQLLDAFADRSGGNGSEGGNPANTYILTAWITGEPYHEYAQQGGLPEREIREVVLSVLAGLAELHARGYAHLGLRPDHVMVTESDAVLLVTQNVRPLPAGRTAGAGATSAMQAEEGEDSLVEYPPTNQIFQPPFLRGELWPRRIRAGDMRRADLYGVGLLVLYGLVGLQEFAGNRGGVPPSAQVSADLRDFLECCTAAGSAGTPRFRSVRDALEHPWVKGSKATPAAK